MVSISPPPVNMHTCSLSLTFELDNVVAGQTEFTDVAELGVQICQTGYLVVGKVQHTQVGKILQSKNK